MIATLAIAMALLATVGTAEDDFDVAPVFASAPPPDKPISPLVSMDREP